MLTVCMFSKMLLSSTMAFFISLSLMALFSTTMMQITPPGGCEKGPSVVSVTNVLFERTSILSEWTERNQFMNWFIPLTVQLSSAAWIFSERCSQRAGGDSLACAQRTAKTWFMFALLLVHDSQTYCTHNCRCVTVHRGHFHNVIILVHVYHSKQCGVSSELCVV